MTITLFDITSTFPSRTFSSNTLKARLALNYKGIPFKTEWLEYPDIEATCKKIGAPPTAKKADGSDHYTLPVIHDSETSRVIADSFAIAEYLDATYPDTPTLFPAGTRGAVALADHLIRERFASLLRPLLLPTIHAHLNPTGSAYFRATREQWYSSTMEDLFPPGPKREEGWAKVKEGLTVIAEAYERNGTDKLYLFGDTFSYADLILASFVLWPRNILGAENPEWLALASWNGGRWGRLAEVTEKYRSID